MYWAGWVLTVLLVGLFCFSASMKLMKIPQAVEGLTKSSYELDVIQPLGAIEAGCAVLYLIPQTAVLGAVLLTGYLGGATATHVAAEESSIHAVIIGVAVWLGIFLRDRRLWALLPFRR
jgi:hypothetical protein